MSNVADNHSATTLHGSSVSHLRDAAAADSHAVCVALLRTYKVVSTYYAVREALRWRF